MLRWPHPGRVPCTQTRPRISVPWNPHWVGLVSFPRSGNTWLRFLLAHCLWPDETVTFQNLGRFLPDWHRQGDRPHLDRGPVDFPFLLVKGHQEFTRRFPRRIYLYRDGRDTLTAYYHWLKGREPTPLKSLLLGQGPHGCWSKHVHSWLDGEPESTCFVSFEQLISATPATLLRLLDFLQVNRTLPVIHRAVERSGFLRLQALEKEHGIFDGIDPVSLTNPFIRKGIVGDWTSLFDDADHQLFWKHHGTAMDRLGYRVPQLPKPRSPKEFAILGPHSHAPHLYLNGAEPFPRST